ncbi:MAG: alpha/beta hydrolase-fold protein [Chloroherpetonaceae bacterium]|nr:alpha/beta hydrolase-fold protein [Chloroherpetonaceae bacterium]
MHTGTYFSQALQRDQSYAYFLPPAVSSTRPAPLLVLLHGLGGSYMDWPAQTRIARYAAQFHLIIAFPDGDSGWYTNALDGTSRYEDDLIQDFLPHLQRTLPLLPPGKHWAIGGLSMGGYGAVKIALKHTHLFSLAVSHSGAFDEPHRPEPHPVFGDPQTQAHLRMQESVYAQAELALCRYPVDRPRLMLDCGQDDPLLPASRRFKDHLTFIGYLHTYREMPGHHTWPYWDRAFRTALPEIAQQIGAQTT